MNTKPAYLSAPPLKTVLQLSWPTILEQIMLTLVSYVDTAMVGSLGALASDAVAINTPVAWLLNGLLIATGVGFSVLSARHRGAGEHEKLKEVVSTALIFSLLAGILMTLAVSAISPILPRIMGAEESYLSGAVGYLFFIGAGLLFRSFTVVISALMRSVGDTRTPMVVNIVINATNVIMNFLFIYPTRTLTLFGRSFTMWGTGWGVSGAAIATSASFVIGCIMILIILFARESLIRVPFPRNLKMNKDVVRRVVKVGLPSAFDRMTLSIGQIVITSLVTSLGAVPLAAHYIAITAESICYLPSNGFASAGGTLVGQALGAGEPKLAKRFGRITAAVTVITQGLSGVLLFVFSSQLMGLFTNDLAVIDAGSQVLRIVAVVEPMFAASIAFSGVLNGAGDTRFPFYTSLICMWGVRIFCIIIVLKVLHLGLNAVWVAMSIDLTMRAVLTTWRFEKGKWQTAYEDTFKKKGVKAA